jgi:asparagine synthase (glutamine-hydrolysing)
MCGIAGMQGPGADPDLVQAMVQSVLHRGPDGSGIYHDRDTVLGHTRLSIVDLETGDQPMSSADGTIWIVYNGEIYNFRELRARLEADGHRFTTRSDTEVLIQGYRAWGLDLLPRLDGMFAFALWDKTCRRLVLARDLFGIKPLHYTFDGSTLRFASEIKAILQDRSVPRQVDFQALHWFMNLRYVPGERTLFRGIRRLLPGHCLLFENRAVSIRRFAELELPDEPVRDEDHYVEGIRHHLRQAVRKQLIGDVPIGVTLSGGLDSSSLLAMMSEETGQPVQTFSLGFGEPTDELDDARVAANHFGSQHHELTLAANPLQDFPAVIWAAEEPKENILQGYLLARFARQHVKAVQGGLGGDELFAGYVIHRFLYPTDTLHRLTPRWLQRYLMQPISRALFRGQAATGLLRLDEYRRGLQLGLAMGDPCRYYLILRNTWDYDAGAFQLYGPAWQDQEVELTHTAFDSFFHDRHRHVLERALVAEMRTKMVDDFLLNEDRTSMASGLEVRVPFLDRDLVRFAMTIPVDLRIRGNLTKSIFRRAMQPYLAEHTIQKKKWGFTFDPHQQFVHKDLRTVADRILTRQRVEDRGWFSYRFLRRIIEYPPHPRLRWHYFIIWLALGLEIWAQMFLDGDMVNPTTDLEAYW